MTWKKTDKEMQISKADENRIEEILKTIQCNGAFDNPTLYEYWDKFEEALITILKEKDLHLFIDGRNCLSFETSTTVREIEE